MVCDGFYLNKDYSVSVYHDGMPIKTYTAKELLSKGWFLDKETRTWYKKQ